MWLVLTDSNDPLAPWLTDGLRRRTTETVQVLSPVDFFDNVRFDHHLDGDEAYFELETRDGQVVDSRQVTGVVNRLQSFPAQAVAHLQPGDRLYGMMEMSALLTSCLHALRCPVLNPVGAQALTPDLRLDFEWAALAARAGLTCLARAASPFAAAALLPPLARAADAETARVLVVGDTVLTPPDVVVDGSVQRGCHRLALLSRTPLLAVDLVRSARSGWRFAGVDARPDPSSFGSDALDALAEALDRPCVGAALTGAAARRALTPLAEPAPLPSPLILRAS